MKYIIKHIKAEDETTTYMVEANCFVPNGTYFNLNSNPTKDKDVENLKDIMESVGVTNPYFSDTFSVREVSKFPFPVRN